MIPKISIIIPVYHVEEYITMCLQSVANQTMTEGVECVIVDDCGGDNSITIAENFIDNYNGPIDFKIVYRESNKGLSAARNSGIEASIGEYLYFLDSDDEITPDCLEQMWKMVEKYGNIDLIQGVFVQTSEMPSAQRLENLFPEFTKDKKVIKQLYLKFHAEIIPAQAKLINRKFLINHRLFFKDGIIHEDNYWTFFLAKHVSSLAFCNNFSYFHRLNPTSITHAINIVKECVAYKTIITDFCNNMDSFLIGKQKELILSTLEYTLYSNFFNDKEKAEMINIFAQKNGFLERRVLYYALRQKNHYVKAKLLHILIRLYNI